MGKSKKLLKVYENKKEKQKQQHEPATIKGITVNGCRCLAAAAVFNNSNSQSSGALAGGWGCWENEDGVNMVGRHVAAFDFRNVLRKSKRKK